MQISRTTVLALVAGGTILLTATGANAQWTNTASGISYNSGRVGIGTNTPSGQLHVIGSTGLGSVRAENNGTGAALLGWSRQATGLNYGVFGQSASTGGYGTYGYATATTGTSVGSYGRSDSTSGYGGLFRSGQYGVYGLATNTSGTAVGVYGLATYSQGWGAILKGGRFGVWGEALTAGGYGGYFVGNVFVSGSTGIGVSTPTSPLHVVSSASTTTTKIANSNTTTALPVVDVVHASNQGFGLSVNASKIGVSTATAILGRSEGDGGTGVWGIAGSATGSAYGVFGQSSSVDGTGVYARNNATSGLASALVASTNAPNGNGVWGYCNSSVGDGVGVFGSTQSTAGGRGVYGAAFNSSGVSYGVVGAAGTSGSSWGVYALGPLGATGTKSFQIDHPLDPANKFLTHYCSEGPEPINMYRGTIVLNEAGEAEVELPSYFEALNRDFHYQLTPIGAPAVVFVSREIKDNRFAIAGGQPNMKVSWTVTGVRNDAFVQAYPTHDEQEKPAALRGKYLHPEFFGFGEDRSIISRTAPQALPTPKTPAMPRSLSTTESSLQAPVPTLPDAVQQ